MSYSLPFVSGFLAVSLSFSKSGLFFMVMVISPITWSTLEKDWVATFDCVARQTSEEMAFELRSE